MKKAFILALFILGMCNASVFGMSQEIILTELYSIMPLDDPERETLGGRPNPNLIIASIDGDQLSVSTDTDERAYVEVIDPETGEVIVEGEVEGETTMNIPEEGDYEVYIYTESGMVLTGEFVVE
jgi:hypothetical protein